MSEHRFARPSRAANYPRLVVLLALAAGCGFILALSGLLPAPKQEATTRASGAPPEADLMYRLGLLVDMLHPVNPQDAHAQDFQQSALASYERQALGPSPTAAAWMRLGVIYSKEGYLEQGREAFGEALKADADLGRLSLLLSYIYDPTAPPHHASEADLVELQRLEPWLTAYVLPDYYSRLGQKESAQQAQKDWTHRLLRYGAVMAGVALVYLLLAIAGLLMIALFLWKKLLTRPMPPLPVMPVRVPWHPLEAIEAMLVLVFGLLLLGLGARQLLASMPAYDHADVVKAVVIGTAYLIYMGVALAFALKHTRAVGWQAWRLLGFRARHKLATFGLGVRGYALLIGGGLIAMVLLGRLFGDLQSPTQQPSPEDLLSGVRSPAALALYFFLAVILAPIVEETLFRGFIYPGLRRTLQPAGAIVLTSLLFAGVHMSVAPGQAAAIAVVGVMLALLYERTRSILPCIAAHSLHNFLVYCIVVAQVLF